MKIALVQMNSVKEPDANIQIVMDAFDDAARQQADVIAFPENFLVMAASAKSMAAIDWSDYIGQIQACSDRLGIACLAGSMALPGKASDDKRFSAASLYFDGKGSEPVRYNKIHLFDATVGDEKGVYKESDYYRPGDKAVFVDTPWGRMGMSICFDLRFPLLFNYYKQLGVDFIYIPAAFTAVTGRMHWEILLRARAIENQCFIIAPNQTGVHADGRRTWGHSMVVAPTGEVLLDMQQEPGIAVLDLDHGLLDKARQMIPLKEADFD